MNKDQSLALYQKGSESWNAWATDLLARQNDSDEWKRESAVDFSSHTFGKADFSEFTFPGPANFSGATFAGHSWFVHTEFKAAAKFEKAIFRNETNFIETVFGQGAWFEEVVFEGNAHFANSTFRGSADFRKTNHNATTSFIGSSFEDIVFFDESIFHNYAMFKAIACKGSDSWFYAEFKDGVTFEHSCFEGNAHFRETTFEDQTFFMHTRFGRDASFGGFCGIARFDNAVFDGEARFAGTIFKQLTRFDNAKFNGGARFENCIFEGDVAFLAATFGRYAIFHETDYRGQVSFQAVEARSAFTMANAAFSDVPIFDQATFSEAPRLDNFEIRARNEDGLLSTQIWTVFGRNSNSKVKEKREELRRKRKELGVRWRTLRRLATQGHDHQRELFFFREEVLASRWIIDKPWHAFFWFGALYQLCSDFGRSVSRPLVCWLIWLLAFSAAYLMVRPDVGGGEMVRSCSRVDLLEPWIAALGLSTYRNLPAISGLGDRIQAFHSSLYGIGDACVALVPSAVSFLGVVQTIGSAALLFLVLLALRNRFRIR